jgi:AcrR family transcriptional regulator
VPAEVAARLVGFSPATFYRYMRGTSDDQVAFAREVHQARARLQARLTATVVQGAYSDPAIALKALERLFPQHWRVGSSGIELDFTGPTARGSAREQRVIVDLKFVAEIVPRLLEAGRGADDEVTDPALFERGDDAFDDDPDADAEPDSENGPDDQDG